jgi:hypothetical protein
LLTIEGNGTGKSTDKKEKRRRRREWRGCKKRKVSSEGEQRGPEKVD